MKSYRNDPRWITARFASKCEKCKADVSKGAEVYYYPLTKTVHCTTCGKDSARQFQAEAFDESVYGCM